MLKVEHKFEKYLDISEGNFFNSFINFRMCNNYLPVEKRRWCKQDLINRKCRLGNLNEIGDEFHYLFKRHFLQTIELLLYPIDYAEIRMYMLIKM